MIPAQPSRGRQLPGGRGRSARCDGGAVIAAVGRSTMFYYRLHAGNDGVARLRQFIFTCRGVGNVMLDVKARTTWQTDSTFL
jgi:hypothetical protein